jgi:glutamate/tyrosine decarboxylase-like PLP-dependent enzyme
MEINAPVVSNIVCFRYNPHNLNETELEKLNKMILEDIYKKAFLMISDTTVKGRYVLRACNVNHRTKKEDIDYLINEIKKLGRKNSIKMNVRAR